jgi:hypothetical protein
MPETLQRVFDKLLGVDMNIIKVEVIVPEGSYVIGDPCYAVPDKDWDDLLLSCNYFESPIGYVKDGMQKFPVLAFSTRWGDGTYRGSDGNDYPVDAGLIGLVPVEMVEDLAEHTIVEFNRDTLCVNDGSGNLRFGHITIDTALEDEGDEDEND